MPLAEAWKVLRQKGPFADEFWITDGEESRRNFGSVFVWLDYIWIQITFIITDGMFKFFLVYIVISFLGILLSPIFYSFHLLDAVNWFPTLKNVIRSVTLRIEQLLITALLVVIIIYIFSVFGFSFLYDFYYDELPNNLIGSKKGESGC